MREALLSEAPPEKVFLRREAAGRLREIADLARDRGVPAVTTSEAELLALGGAGHQGVAALVSPHASAELEDLEPRQGALCVALDGVTDPMNLGAVLRSAEGAGCDALILPKRRSAPLTPAAVRASAGAAQHLPIVKVTSLAEALRGLRERGFTILGLDPSGRSLYEPSTSIAGALVVVLGEEGRGLHRLVRERCDALCSIPMRGRVESLNVSVACGIALFEIRRAQAASCRAGACPPP